MLPTWPSACVSLRNHLDLAAPRTSATLFVLANYGIVLVFVVWWHCHVAMDWQGREQGGLACRYHRSEWSLTAIQLSYTQPF